MATLKEHHKRLSGWHKRAGALGIGDKDHAERPAGHPLHVAHHGHKALGEGLSAVEGVFTIGEKVMWTGIKWGVGSILAIGIPTYLTHNVDNLMQFQGAFDLPHDLAYGLGAAGVTAGAAGRRGWIEGKAILGHVGSALDHGETAVRSAGKVPAYTRGRMSSMKSPRG